MTDLYGFSANLTDLISYQEGSVVSKELIGKEKGSLTLFAFSQGQGLSEHTAPFDAFVYILEGKAEITISKEVKTVNYKEGIIMPANKPHSVKAVEPFKMLLVMIRA
ncbi:MAG: Cupin domain protein [Candidatus Omnitrophica bacterium ADurb.Bin205]|nr:MAG: Cupin domain protein [Candidatus Omnitrophica bacterium ADurb.Bin205]